MRMAIALSFLSPTLENVNKAVPVLSMARLRHHHKIALRFGAVVHCNTV
jgi:hypothetical protein